ncbi:MAG: anti-phage BREX system Lon protease BrxL [Bacillota bacterium]
MRDWLVMKFSDELGNINHDSVNEYIKRYIPGREDFEQFKYQMVNGEIVRFLARIRVTVNIKTGKTTFELPDFGGSRTGAAGEVDKHVVEDWQDVLLRERVRTGESSN